MLNPQEIQVVLSLIDQAVRAGGTNTAHVAMPIVYKLHSEAEKLAKEAAEPAPKEGA